MVSSTCTHAGIVDIYNCLDGTLQNIKLDFLKDNPVLLQLDETLESSVLELNSKVHIVLLKPKQATKKLPLIVIPHGGPNSVYSIDYVLYPVIFAKLGYAVASSKVKLWCLSRLMSF